MEHLEPFVYEVPANPVCPAHKVLAVRPGSGLPTPVLIYEGRQCYVSGHARTRAKVGWRFYNMVIVRFLDDGSADAIPAGRFAKAKYAPIPPAPTVN